MIVFFEKIKNWGIEESRKKRGEYVIYTFAFIDSSFFPVSPLFLLVPMIMARKEGWMRLVFFTTIFSVLGGYLGYGIGYSFYELIGRPLVVFYGLTEEMIKLQNLFDSHAFATIFLASFTPIPYKVFTIGSGLFHINLFTFTMASLFGRAIRFFVIGYISEKFGLRALQIARSSARMPLIIIVLSLLVFVYAFLRW